MMEWAGQPREPGRVPYLDEPLVLLSGPTAEQVALL